jgi:hypothetical protein
LIAFCHRAIGLEAKMILPHHGTGTSLSPLTTTVRLKPSPGVRSRGEGPGRANPYAEAGRKGARRVHELIRRGRLYEEEHGLKGGRQRLRQLLEEGKLYEQEHGLSPQRRKARGPRVSSEQLLRRLLEVVLRLAKPRYRPHLLALVRALGDEAGGGGEKR